MKASFLILCLLPATLPVANGNEQLTVRVSPAQSFAPTTVRIQVRVEPSSENRSLVIVADSGEYYRSSVISLEGADAPATFTLSYRDVPAGDYQVHCALVDSGGRQRAAARATLSVISSTL